jgi:hypothetical protein
MTAPSRSEAAGLNHDRFLRHLDESQGAVMAVAGWLKSMGFPVRINPTFKRPHHADWREYADSGDLEIGQRIEVKHRPKILFTGPDDWPHPNFIVCAKHAWDRAHPRPHAFICLSGDFSHAGIVYGRDWKEWAVEEKRDSRYADYKQLFLVAQLSSVRWMRVGR